jgi:hypothetical protein
MADEQNSEKNIGGDDASESANVRRKAVRRVVVTHLDEPPPSGKHKIHPRRPAPIVPTREERTEEQPDEDEKTDKPDSE